MNEATNHFIYDHHLVESFKRRGPCVVFAYAQERLVQKGVHGECRILLSYEGQPTDEMKLGMQMLETLRALRREADNEMIFSLENIILPERLQSNPHDRTFAEGLLFVAIGISHDYAKKGNNDMVDAMYAVDGWGARVLQEGLALKKEPFWAMSNYNFNGSTNMHSVRQNNPTFLSLLNGLKARMAPEVTNAPTGI